MLKRSLKRLKSQESPDAEAETTEREETQEVSDVEQVVNKTEEAQEGSNAEGDAEEDSSDIEEMTAEPAEFTASVEAQTRKGSGSVSAPGAKWAPLQSSYSELSSALSDQLRRAHASLPSEPTRVCC